MDELDRLAAIFDRKNDDGSFYYSDEDVRHWLPLIIIACDFAVDTWTDEMRLAMSTMAVRAQLDPERDDGRMLEKINAYYKRYPVNPELLRELAELTADLTLAEHEQTARRAFLGLKNLSGPLTRVSQGLAPPTAIGATRPPKRR